ncbi:MAG: hypothetical protein ACO3PN_10000 [Chthoniobacterales bacterium]
MPSVRPETTVLFDAAMVAESPLEMSKLTTEVCSVTKMSSARAGE